MHFKKVIFFIPFIIITNVIFAQAATIIGKVISQNNKIGLANILLANTTIGAISDSNGNFIFKNVPAGEYILKVSCISYNKLEKKVVLIANDTLIVNLELEKIKNDLNEVVITGTQKATRRLESPVNVEVYTPTYFKKNPTANIFEALQNVNGVRPQLNCNVCNTSDIHINGLEGPYTMVLIDGMPIVSSLSTVYGLSGIPNALIERIEIVKGPASSLYGSEAVGGLINIITKNPQNAPIVSADIFATTWQEVNTDIGFKLYAAKKATVLTGINYFNFQKIVDNNKDNFTDMTLQNRLSIFQKWNIARKEGKLFTLAARYMFENRWGGDTRWNKTFRGGDSIYGESIYTSRYEVLGNYELPTKEKLMLSFSFNTHNQDSRYGTTSFIATQNIGFTQLTWDKTIGKNDILLGAALRYTFYDDNTPATAFADTIKSMNQPQITWLPGIFLK